MIHPCDRRTDGRAIAYTRYSIYAVARKKWMLDYQLTVLLVEVVCALKVRSLYETYTWEYTWRPLACYAFVNIKLASYYLLLYVVYLCQKS